MTSSRRTAITATLIVVVVLAGTIWTLRSWHMLQSTPSGTAVSCGHRLTWVTGIQAVPLAVVAESRQDAWAVGSQRTQAVIMHWNGSSWTNSSLPVLNGGTSLLNAVAAVSATDIWAVGGAGLQPLILHWNGQTWSQVDAAAITAYGSRFSALTVVNATDIWAAGIAWSAASSTPTGIAEHWNGQIWSVAPAPPGGVAGALAADSSGAVWSLTASGIFHWTGRAWQAALIANHSAIALNLQTLAVNSDGTVWVAGSYVPQGSDWPAPILESWNGTSWAPAPIDEPESDGAEITNLAVGTDGTVWAAGSLRNPNTRLSDAFVESVGSQGGAVRLKVDSHYPLFYNDPDNGDSFNVTGVSAVPGADGAWVVGSTGTVPNPYLPPIDSNLPVASGGFALSYC